MQLICAKKVEITMKLYNNILYSQYKNCYNLCRVITLRTAQQHQTQSCNLKDNDGYVITEYSHGN